MLLFGHALTSRRHAWIPLTYITAIPSGFADTGCFADTGRLADTGTCSGPADTALARRRNRHLRFDRGISRDQDCALTAGVGLLTVMDDVHPERLVAL